MIARFARTSLPFEHAATAVGSVSSSLIEREALTRAPPQAASRQRSGNGRMTVVPRRPHAGEARSAPPKFLGGWTPNPAATPPLLADRERVLSRTRHIRHAATRRS